jgi:large subunit ribosomal protein L10
MNRQQKERVVAEFREMFSSSKASFMVLYRGLSVAEMQELRRKLRSDGARLKVTKARLMKIAVSDLDGLDKMSGYMKDQVGVVFADDDVPPVAKDLVEFSKEKPNLEVVAAFFENKVITPDEIKALALIPPREQLLGMVVGTVAAPLSGFLRVLNGVILKLLYALKDLEKKKSAE